MKEFMSQYQKQLCVAFLLALIVAMDFLKIQDAELRYVLMGLIGTVTGWHGLTTLMSNGKTPPAQ
jgi:uncharacterized membrane protein YjjB (DUF3815 family)